MSNQYQAGDKIEYQLFDKKGKGHWFKGVIHGVRSYEGETPRVTYLVDTGRDERVDEIITAEDEDNIFVRQPEQIELPAEHIRPV